MLRSLRFRSFLSPLLGCAVAAPGLAQVPAHATLLNPTQSMAGPTFAQNGDVVHALAPTAYARSADGGRTWPVREQLLGLQSLKQIVVDAGRTVVAGLSSTSLPSLVVSTDDGATWNAPQAISPLAQSASDVRVHLSGQLVVALWTGNSGAGRVWTSRSTDGGATWSPALQLHQPVVQPIALALAPNLIASGNTVNAFWLMLDPFAVVQQQVSNDGGLTWLAQPRSHSALAGAPVGGTPAAMFAVPGTLLRSLDGGLTWNNLPVPGMAQVRGVAAQGSTLLVTGEGPGSPFTYVANVSTNGGASWQANPFVVGSYSGFGPWPSIVGSDFYVSFDNPTNVAASALIHSANVGASWRVVQSGLSLFSPGPLRNLHVATTSSPTLGLQWHVYVGAGTTTLGVGTAGTGSTTPTLSMTRVPLLGNATNFKIESALGGSVGVLGLATAAPFATPFGGGTLWLQGPLATAVFTTGGSAGAGGVGTGQVPLTVPTTATLAGLSVVAQAAVVDAVASGGLALTNGCEVWLR